MDIAGKTVLVTGANRGIGKAIVNSLVAEGAERVYAAVRNPSSAQPLVDEHGDRIVPMHLDLNDPASITAAAGTAGDVDIVINNAGVLQRFTDLLITFYPTAFPREQSDRSPTLLAGNGFVLERAWHMIGCVRFKR